MIQARSYSADSIATITGDFSGELLADARKLLKANPTSILAYAFFNAAREIHDVFEDEQGIPISLAEEVDRSILVPVKALLREGALTAGSLPSEEAVEGLLGGLVRLHNSGR
jgi:hypothetical protein